MRSMWRYIYWITLWILFFGLTVKHSIFTVVWPQCQLQHTQVITFMAGSSSIPCHGTFMTARVAHTFVRIHMDKKNINNHNTPVSKAGDVYLSKGGHSMNFLNFHN